MLYVSYMQCKIANSQEVREHMNGQHAQTPYYLNVLSNLVFCSQNCWDLKMKTHCKKKPLERLENWAKSSELKPKLVQRANAHQDRACLSCSCCSWRKNVSLCSWCENAPVGSWRNQVLVLQMAPDRSYCVTLPKMMWKNLFNVTFVSELFSVMNQGSNGILLPVFPDLQQ